MSALHPSCLALLPALLPPRLPRVRFRFASLVPSVLSRVDRRCAALQAELSALQAREQLMSDCGGMRRAVTRHVMAMGNRMVRGEGGRGGGKEGDTKVHSQ